MTIVLVTHLMDDVAAYVIRSMLWKRAFGQKWQTDEVFQDEPLWKRWSWLLPKITAFCKRLADRGVAFKKLPIKIEEFKESLNG